MKTQASAIGALLLSVSAATLPTAQKQKPVQTPLAGAENQAAIVWTWTNGQTHRPHESPRDFFAARNGVAARRWKPLTGAVGALDARFSRRDARINPARKKLNL